MSFLRLTHYCEDEFERALYFARKAAEKASMADADNVDLVENFYVCTMHPRTIVYKARRRCRSTSSA